MLLCVCGSLGRVAGCNSEHNHVGVTYGGDNKSIRRNACGTEDTETQGVGVLCGHIGRAVDLRMRRMKLKRHRMWTQGDGLTL